MLERILFQNFVLFYQDPEPAPVKNSRSRNPVNEAKRKIKVRILSHGFTISRYWKTSSSCRELLWQRFFFRSQLFSAVPVYY